MRKSAVLWLFTLLTNCLGIPKRGNFPWSVVLCKFGDIASEPRSPAWFGKWLGNSEGSINNYFTRISNGQYTIDGSNVYGWFTLPYSRSDIYALARADEHLAHHADIELKFYYKAKSVCVGWARQRGARLHDNTITVVNARQTAVFCRENGVLLSPRYLISSALAHEMAHGFHIGHSYSDRRVQVFPHAVSGEYDDKYDLMSTANAYMHNSPFGWTGPGLNGPHLDYLGWLPMDRVHFLPLIRRQRQSLRLASLSAPHADTKRTLLVVVPYDREDPLNVFTVELRTPTGADSGIGNAAVVIHRLEKRGGYFFSFLVTHGREQHYELLQGDVWRQDMERDARGNVSFIQVQVERVDASEHSATVIVTSTFDPSSCGAGTLQRHIAADDNVCVTPEQRGRIAVLNGLSARRTGADGRCLPSFVERRAVADDRVCVSVDERRETDGQNERQRRRDFGAVRTWGLNACVDGHIWRNLDAYDYTCVQPERQRQAKREGRPVGADGQCDDRLDRRDAFHGDASCVPAAEKHLVQLENEQTKNNFVYYKFLNGVDSL